MGSGLVYGQELKKRITIKPVSKKKKRSKSAPAPSSSDQTQKGSGLVYGEELKEKIKVDTPEQTAVKTFAKTGSADVSMLSSAQRRQLITKAVSERAKTIQTERREEKEEKPQTNRQLIEEINQRGRTLQYENLASPTAKLRPIQARIIIGREAYRRKEAPINAVVTGIKQERKGRSAINYAISTPPMEQSLNKFGISRYGKVEETNIKNADQPSKQTNSEISVGSQKRIKDLLEREKRLETFKETVYKKTGLTEDTTVSYKSGVLPYAKEVGKGVLRFPVEFGSMFPYVGGRVALSLDLLTSKAGREESARSFKLIPTAIKESFDLRKPSGLVNLGFALASVKSIASNPPKFLLSKSKNYIPYEEAGFKVTEGTTEPYSQGEILRTQGRQVTGIHTTYDSPFAKSLGEFIKNPFGKKNVAIVESQPGLAKGFRSEIGSQPFYKSLPVKEEFFKYGDTTTGIIETLRIKPQAYGGYIGIGKQYSSGSVFKLFPKEAKAVIFESEVIDPLTSVEYSAMKTGGVAGGKKIVGYQTSSPNLGRSFIPAENLLGRSVEGQYISPEGSALVLENSGTFTYYRTKSTIPNQVIRNLQDRTGIGLKDTKINIVKARTVNPVLLDKASADIKGISGANLKDISIYRATSSGKKVVSVGESAYIGTTAKSSSAVKSLFSGYTIGFPSSSGYSVSYGAVGSYSSISKPVRSASISGSRNSVISSAVSIPSYTRSTSSTSRVSSSKRSYSIISPVYSTPSIPGSPGSTPSTFSSIRSVSVDRSTPIEPKMGFGYPFGLRKKQRIFGKKIISKVKYKHDVTSRVFGLSITKTPSFVTPFTNRPMVNQ